MDGIIIPPQIQSPFAWPNSRLLHTSLDKQQQQSPPKISVASLSVALSLSRSALLFRLTPQADRRRGGVARGRVEGRPYRYLFRSHTNEWLSCRCSLAPCRTLAR